VPFTALYWCALEPLRSRLLSYSLVQRSVPFQVDEKLPSKPPTSRVENASSRVEDAPDVSEAPPTSRVLWANLIAGSVSGALAAAATTPFDVVKTRLQTMPMNSEAGLSAAAAPLAPEIRHHSCRSASIRGPGSALHVLPTPVRGSTIGMLRDIYQSEGARGLFAGVGPRVARAAPACAIVIATYEVLKTAL
jgi:solute carrier family 25 protein 39/40